MITVILATALTGCNNTSPNMSPTKTATVIQMPVLQTQKLLSPALQTVIGDYATTDYENRAQGYDWVGVMVRLSGSQEIDITVRSRNDIKKPTCSFNGKATLMGQDNAHGIIFQSKINNSMAFFRFKDHTLTIDSQDKYALNYFCSGGGSLVGNYEKLEGDLELN